MKIDVSIIIVSFNTADLLRLSLSSIERHVQGCAYEVIVVDNDSQDGSIALVREEFPAVHLIVADENLGFGKANNLGVEAAKGEAVFLFNSDAVLLEDTVTSLWTRLRADPSLAAVGPRVLLKDGSDQPKTWGFLPTLRRLWNQNTLLCRIAPRSRFFAGIYVEAVWGEEMEAGWISGVCMMITRRAFREVGGFSPQFFMYAEDVDLCRRLREKNYQILRIHNYAVEHLCGGSTKSAQQVLKYRVMQQRNFLLLCDQSMTRLQRWTARAITAGGLFLRALLQATGLLLGNGRGRIALKTSLACLQDLFRNTSPKNSVPSSLPASLRPLRIGIDGHSLGASKGGAERQVANLLYWLPQLRPEVEWHCFVRPDYSPPASLQADKLHFVPLHSRHLFLQRMVELPFRSWGLKLDLLHVQRIAPLFSPVPVVVTIHDLLPCTAPADHRTLNDRVMRLLTGPTLRRVHQVFTVSEAAKQDILSLYPAVEKKVRVVSNGIDHFEDRAPGMTKPLSPTEDAKQNDLPTSSITLPDEEYILYFGAVMERKNLEVLLGGYLQCPAQSTPPLVIAGMVRSPELLDRLVERVRAAAAQERVYFLGAVPESEIAPLFRRARLFLAPSRGEGFDLPPVEALSHGIAVLASDIAVHREVLKQAAHYFAVDCSADLARALQDLLSAPACTEQERAARLRVAALYTWQTVAAHCAAGYFDTLALPIPSHPSSQSSSLLPSPLL